MGPVGSHLLSPNPLPMARSPRGISAGAEMEKSLSLLFFLSLISKKRSQKVEKKKQPKKKTNKKPNKLVFSSVLESTWINNGSRTRAAGTINFLCPRPKKEAAAALPAAGVQREEDAARRLIVGRGWWGWGAQLCFAL